MESRHFRLDFRAKETEMRIRLRRLAFPAAVAGLALASALAVSAGDEKALIGSYALAKRVAPDGKTLTGPEVMGFMTFTKTHRTVIMKWNGSSPTPTSIALIATYTLSGGKYCESVSYGVEGNLRAPGVAYDTPSDTPVCTAAISDASGLAFDVPGDNLRLRVTRDGIIATTPRWTDHWAKVK
jgi:hypothetical protein